MADHELPDATDQAPKEKPGAKTVQSLHTAALPASTLYLPVAHKEQPEPVAVLPPASHVTLAVPK